LFVHVINHLRVATGGEMLVWITGK